jgi:hypothetical protein
MKKISYLLIAMQVIAISHTYGQSTFIDSNPRDPATIVHSWDGARLPTEGMHRILIIYVNMIYDVQGINDPIGNNAIWPQAQIEGINVDPSSWPSYINEYISVDYPDSGPLKTFTRLFVESSFNNLIVLGDYLVVNIKHSTISGGGTFFPNQLINSVITLINSNGGLQTLHGHNSIMHYQSLPSIEKFYHVMMILRNTTKPYGGVGKGNGQAWGPSTGSIIDLYTADDDYFDTYTISYQCVGDQDISMNPTIMCTHEFSHFLFGSNNFHTSGGHSWGETMCYPSLQYGYGLMGAASSGLVNCNGYERYRVGWMHEDNDEEWPITAIDANSLNRKISDITKADGNQSFKLDNFITSGDVIRIKLPYIESPASNQYIWLENHKIMESTLNFLQYSNTDPICRPQAQKGIYAYYQVGRDILYGPDSLVYSAKYDTDNLRMICANGFYDQVREGVASSTQCPGDKMHFRDIRPNTIAGNNDLSSYYFDYEGFDELIPGVHGGMAEAKTYFNSNEPNVKRPFLMSEINPFHDHSVMSVNTNPSPFNTVTYYHAPYRVEEVVYTVPKDTFRNQPDVILTGLKIEMTPLANDDYQVDISWDNYDLDSEVRWMGSIVLKEELYLTSGSILLLDQNLTPNTIYRNETTGLFSAPTILRCDDGSKMFQEEGSELLVDNLSTLLIDNGSKFYANAGRMEVKNDAYLQIASGGYFEQNQDAEIYADDKGTILIEKNGYYLLDGGTLTIKTGGRLEIEGCATLEIKNGGLLVVEEDAVICVHPGAILDFESTNNYSFDPNFSTGECVVFNAQNFLESVLAEPPTYSITGTVVWDDVIYNFHDDLHIEPGAQLTVEGGSILRFGLDKRIKVKAGAICIVDGSVLSSLCSDDVWQGVEVYGDNNKSQYPDAQGTMFQGRLIVRNGSLIENARIAALAGMTASSQEQEGESEGVPNPEIVYGTKGGIIMATSSTFKNNQTGIYLPAYENFHHSDPQTPRNNLSYIRKCDFLWDDGLFTALEAEAFVKLIGVRGINIEGSHFLRQASQAKNGTGILSLSTSFNVKEYCLDLFLPCENYRLSRFENLEYGVKALNYGSAKTFSVDTAQFAGNITGVYTKLNDFFSITRCDVNVLVDYPDYQHFGGVYIENESIGFRVEENDFYSTEPLGQGEGKFSIGVTFNNTGQYNNKLYNNTFTSLSTGVLAMNSNRGVNDEEGLCIKCNLFSENKGDIVVTLEGGHLGGIASHQGSDSDTPDAPAGNRFSWAGNPMFFPFTDINNQGEDIKYFYHVIPNPEEVPLKPKYFNADKVTLMEGDPLAIWDPELSCPSNLTPPGGGHDEEALRGMLVEAGQKADSTQNLINMLKDAGNTQALHWDVSMSAPWQAMEVYSELMSVSPYVSNTVLSAAIEKENVLVDAMIRDVLVVNPHSAKSEALMDKLDQRLQPLPAYMLDEILQGQGLVSAYEKLQSSLSYHKQKQALYNKQLAQFYLNDTINPAAAADSLVSLLLASGHPAHWYRAAILRHEQGNASATAAILNGVLSSFNLNAEQLQSHSHFASWLEHENLLSSQEKSLVIPDSTSVVWLFDIMENGYLPVSIFARNILLAHALVEHQPKYLLPDDTKSSKAKRTRSQNPPKDEALKLYPNPAREYVIVDFDISKMKEIDGTGILTVNNIGGKLVETLPLNKLKDRLVFPLNGYKPGTYVFTIYSGNKILDSKRLIIQ